MTELFILAGVMALSSVLDMRKMLKEKLKREPVIYFAICACALALAIIYFPELSRRSIMSYVLELLGIKV